MNFANADTVFFTLAFLVPGFIMQSMLAVCIPKRLLTAEYALLRYLTLSSINYAVNCWLVYMLVFIRTFRHHPDAALFSWMYIILFSPIILGLLGGAAVQHRWDQAILRKVGLRPLHSIATAFDWTFSTITIDPVWIRVTLTDGSKVHGFYGAGSFASTEPGERDIYISISCLIDVDGRPVDVPRSKGTYIKGDQIRCIEFISDKEETVNV